MLSAIFSASISVAESVELTNRQHLRLSGNVERCENLQTVACRSPGGRKGEADASTTRTRSGKSALSPRYVWYVVALERENLTYNCSHHTRGHYCPLPLSDRSPSPFYTRRRHDTWVEALLDLAVDLGVAFYPGTMTVFRTDGDIGHRGRCPDLPQFLQTSDDEVDVPLGGHPLGVDEWLV